METIIQNKRAPAKVIGNRFYQTLVPSRADETVQIAHMGCVGDTVVSNIQLEKGSVPTEFASPEVNQTPLSGIFSALQGLRIEMRDKESDLWSEIIANNKAMLVSYHNKELSASLGVSAEQIRQEVKNALDG